MRRLRGLGRDRRGATMVESAIILPVFLLLILALMETAWQSAVSIGLDNGTRQASRWASLGINLSDPAARTNEMAIIIVRTSGLPLNSNLITITPSSFPSFAGVNGVGTPGFGGPDSVVKYEISYDSPVLIPFSRAWFPTGFMRYRSVVIEQNEPFPN